MVISDRTPRGQYCASLQVSGTSSRSHWRSAASALVDVSAACVSLVGFDREARCFTRAALPDLQASTSTKLGCFLGLATKGLFGESSDKIIVEYLEGSIMYRACLEIWLSG